MARHTPFHARTSELCHSQEWRQWSGYFAAGTYDEFSQPEYSAIRHSAALIDVSPLYKYRVEGPQAAALLDRVVTQNVRRMKIGQVLYTAWCDDDGKVRQEGTVLRFSKTAFRLCAAEPAWAWLRNNGLGFDAEITDESTKVAGLALQGPLSRDVLRATGFEEIDSVKFFGMLEGHLAGVPVTVSRTGYTGDLGYEIWLPAEAALAVWDGLMRHGEQFSIRACGIKAMDIARVEAGFIMLNVDYVSSEVAKIEADKSTPYELGLGWAVKLKSGPFIGQRALAEEKRRGSKWQLVGLEVDWQPLEDLYMSQGLMPELPMQVDRQPVPIYAGVGGKQVGRVTSRVWSTLLKKYIALATIDANHAKPGSPLAMEVTVRWQRQQAPAHVASTPFFRPPRMRG